VLGVGKGGLDVPLLVARENAKGKLLVFTFDLKKSDLPLRGRFRSSCPTSSLIKASRARRTRRT